MKIYIQITIKLFCENSYAKTIEQNCTHMAENNPIYLSHGITVHLQEALCYSALTVLYLLVVPFFLAHVVHSHRKTASYWILSALRRAQNPLCHTPYVGHWDSDQEAVWDLIQGLNSVDFLLLRDLMAESGRQRGKSCVSPTLATLNPQLNPLQRR